MYNSSNQLISISLSAVYIKSVIGIIFILLTSYNSHTPFKMNSSTDPRRPDKEVRYKSGLINQASLPDDLTPDYMNVIGMIFSMCGLMMRLKWCAWVALYCSCISFANSRINEDAKQILSCFMLSISAVVMSYLQNPQPMTPPWANAMQ